MKKSKAGLNKLLKVPQLGNAGTQNHMLSTPKPLSQTPDPPFDSFFLVLLTMMLSDYSPIVFIS